RAAFSLGETPAVFRSISTDAVTLLPNVIDATAPCALIQKTHWFSRDVYAPNNSRSPTVHSEGPLSSACARSQNGRPKNCGRYIKIFATSGSSDRKAKRTNISAILSGNVGCKSNIFSRIEPASPRTVSGTPTAVSTDPYK